MGPHSITGGMLDARNVHPTPRWLRIVNRRGIGRATGAANGAPSTPGTAVAVGSDRCVRAGDAHARPVWSAAASGERGVARHGHSPSRWDGSGPMPAERLPDPGLPFASGWFRSYAGR